MARYKQYENNPTVYRNTDNYAFSTWDELLKDSGGNPDIEKLPSLQAYKYDNDPTVYNAQGDTPFSSAADFLKAGGNFTSVETRKRPDANRDLAEQAARLGLDPTALQSLYNLQNAPTGDEKQKIRDELGIPDLEASVFAPPSQTTQQLYEKAYGSAGLADLRAKMKALDDQVAARRRDYSKASGNINENPWLDEASRIGRMGTLGDKAQTDINNYLGEFSSYEDLYNQGLDEVNRVIGFQQQDFADTQTRNQAKLNYLLSQAQSKNDALASRGNELLARYLPDYMKSMDEANAASQAATAPDVINTDNGSFQWDATTKTFIPIAGSASRASGGGGGSAGTLPSTAAKLDLGVKQIIAANPGEWGNAADQIDATYGPGTATMYDSWLKSVYQNGQDVNSLSNTTGSLSTGQKDTVATYNTLSELAGQALSLGNKNNWSGTGGGFQGSIGQFMAKNFGTGSAEDEQLRNLIGNIKATIAKARGGTSFTPNEEALLESYTPTINDSPLVLKEKLEGLQKFIRTSVNNINKTAGGGGASSANNDPLGIF